MSTYKVALGHNAADDEMSEIDPQSVAGVIMPAERRRAIDGTVDDLGLYRDLKFDLVHTAEADAEILDQSDLLKSDTCNVTIFSPDEGLTWRRMKDTVILDGPLSNRGR